MDRTLIAKVLPENAADKSVTWSSSNDAIATVSSAGVVTGVAIGSTVITVTTNDGGKTAICSVTVGESKVPVPDAVDLGLPSGLKWASFNLGAFESEEYGDYYAWGETEPHYSSLDPLTWNEGKEAGYTWANYKWCMGSKNTMTKYCSSCEYGSNGLTDTKIVLDSEDDAAIDNLGGKWRIPTDAEFTELREKCTWEWTSVNGINGQKVTGPNGNSIFLPAAGYINNGLSLSTTRGIYWSSSLEMNPPDPVLASCMIFDRYVSGGAGWRCNGYSVRPVSE